MLHSQKENCEWRYDKGIEYDVIGFGVVISKAIRTLQKRPQREDLRELPFCVTHQTSKASEDRVDLQSQRACIIYKKCMESSFLWRYENRGSKQRMRCG